MVLWFDARDEKTCGGFQPLVRGSVARDAVGYGHTLTLPQISDFRKTFSNRSRWNGDVFGGGRRGRSAMPRLDVDARERPLEIARAGG
jgi:hypothetical protein